MAELGKGRRVSGGERDKLAADLKKKYTAGASIRELAASTGRSYGFVHRVLSESGAAHHQPSECNVHPYHSLVSLAPRNGHSTGTAAEVQK